MLTRRTFLKVLAGGLLAAGVGKRKTHAAQAGKSKVTIIKPQDRKKGVHEAVRLLGVDPFRDKDVVMKPNFNSAHPFPGSTHNDTLEALIELARERGAKKITVADRSGMARSRYVMERKGIFQMAQRLGFEAIPLEEIPAEDWEHFPLKGSHWSRGVEMPKLFTQAPCLVQTCCLKTHRFGGHFTMSLKNSVGMVARYSVKDNYDYMIELHNSPYMLEMIAEINVLYKPALIVLDALEAFVRGGPERGTIEKPGAILASTDRVALDAVGVAILRLYETTPEVAIGKIFEHPQIRRAVELGLGAKSVQEIELIPADDPESRDFAGKVLAILAKG